MPTMALYVYTRKPIAIEHSPAEKRKGLPPREIWLGKVVNKSNTYTGPGAREIERGKRRR